MIRGIPNMVPIIVKHSTIPKNISTKPRITAVILPVREIIMETSLKRASIGQNNHLMINLLKLLYNIIFI
jgi:hypothetical protein